jgi:hypothetical protein
MKTMRTVLVCIAALAAAVTTRAQTQMDGVQALEQQDPDANAGKREYAEAPVASVEASSTFRTYDANNLVNGKGIKNGLHSNSWTNMWVSGNQKQGVAGQTLTFHFDTVRKVSQLKVWQYDFEGAANRGVKQFEVFAGTQTCGTYTLRMSKVGKDHGNEAAQAFDVDPCESDTFTMVVHSNYGDRHFVGLSHVSFYEDKGPSASDAHTVAVMAMKKIETDIVKALQHDPGLRLMLKGDKGDRGERGFRGFKGDRGAPGAQGLRGKQGQRGEQGERGEQGKRGKTGIGRRGVTGPTGHWGATGMKGATGMQGPLGATGPRGHKGSSGGALQIERDLIVTFFNDKSIWRGQYRMSDIKAIYVNNMSYGNKAQISVRYKRSPVPPRTDSGIGFRMFDLEYVEGNWKVVKMHGENSGKE